MGILSAFRFAFQNLFFSPILYGVIASLAVFSTVFETGDRFKDQLTDGHRSQDDTFDFIIVGGGSAGAVLANRLSQYHTVLLLEAGGESHPFQAIPGLAIFIPKNPGTDWMHKSVTQTKSCLACPHKKYILSQGKNLGGSGNINYMIHMRGNPLDFDNWATITGDPSWSYDGVLPYFIQSEHYVGETTDKDAHGHGGPLNIEIPDCIGLANEWNSAGVEMGYLHVDLNGRHSEGFDTAYYPIKRGLRQATYRSYIQPVRKRQSLLIRKFAHVNKVLIRDDGSNAAYGVEYDRHGHNKQAFANREVILSAGTLQTPKLLVLSGVGQLEHLNALHIPVKSVLPVGKNLQDHFSTLLGPFYINKARTISFDRDVDKQSFVKFAISGKGPLSSTGFMANAVVASSIANGEGQGGWPDIQLTLFGLTPHRMFYNDIGHAFGIRPDILHRYYGDADADGKENAFFIMVTLARPYSKGDYCLPTKDPYKPPQIDPNYLMDPEGHDAKVMVEGIHRALFLAENTTAFQELGTHYSQKCFPGCDNVPFRSDAYWECYIRQFSIASNDHVGTCPMGKVGSPYAVVDPELRVQGVKRLRVVDASVMPTIVGAPTQAATIMIAEKASALILDEWKHEANSYYGVPGVTPGTPVASYGPPAASPGNNIGPQYGAPGMKPAPLAGGDGFENYDSFTVIRDQFNPPQPNNGIPPTQLIPINPNTQLWSTPAPFPNTGGTPSSIPPFISSVTATSTQFTPEPSVVLLPPEDSHNAPSPTYATSYSTSNNDYNGPIISSTPNYPDSFHSRSEKTLVVTELVDGNNATGSRQGKSFGEASSTVSSLPEGNQLGQGLDDEILHVTTPVPSPTYFSSPGSTAISQSSYTDVTESEVISQGPDFRVVRKRIRTTPRVIVHPRGHLGHQNVPRKITPLNESLESLFLTTSSHRPVPKEIVKIKRRRPGKTRKRTTTTPGPTEVTYITAYSNNAAVELTTTPRPKPTTTSELPTELKSPGRKRFVRRMYARPLNFNGNRRPRATTAAPITVTYGDFDIGTTAHPVIREVRERIDLDTAASTSVEHVREIPITAEPAKYEADDYDVQDDEVDNEANEKSSTIEKPDPTLHPRPVIAFNNIGLENVQQLNRQTRRANDSDYFRYNLSPEESRNPVIPVSSKVVEVPTSQSPESGDVLTEIVTLGSSGITAKGEDETQEEAEVDEVVHEDGEEGDYSDEYDGDEAIENPIEQNVSYLNEAENTTNSSSVNSREELEDEDNGSIPSPNSNGAISFSVSVSDNYSPAEVPSSQSNENVTSSSAAQLVESVTETSVHNRLASKITTESRNTGNNTDSSSSTNPRYLFRARNKLIRIHS